MRVAPYRTTENKILGCVITLVDVTTQKQGLVMLQSAEQQLSLAQQANEAKSDYLSRISHEIRTPMNSLMILTKKAKEQIDNKSELAIELDKMSNTIDYMASIVTEISEASQGERKAATQFSEPFKFREVIDNIISLVSLRAEEAGLSFEISMEDDFDPLYVGNKTKLQQILINFLNNSIKYTPKGGAVSLKAFEETKHKKDSRAALCLIVSDTGIGIKKEFIPSLFKPFTREVKGDKNEPISMGLGLSIAYNLIKSMDGNVSVESEVGSGTTFTIHVLLDKYDPNKAAYYYDDDDEILSGHYGLEGCHILIAEDNELNSTILGAMLASEGMTFVETRDGEEAVKAFIEAPENTFDCILMDMRMPKLDGIKATEIIRESGKNDAKSIPIIGVSANGFADDIKQARNAGLSSYTTKPIERDILLNAMRNLINGK